MFPWKYTKGSLTQKGFFMIITILKSEIVNALGATQGIVERKNVMPILANVLIEADVKTNLLKISATDLEVAVHVFAQAKVEKGGSITLNAHNLYDILKEAPAEEIQLTVSENNRAHISSLNSEYKLAGLPATDFPTLPAIEEKFSRINSDDLLHMLDKVYFAISTDETRYHLNGILLERNDKNLLVVATDGHRLSMTERDISAEKIKVKRAIVPRKGVQEFKRLMAAEKSIEIYVAERHLFVRTEKQTLYIRLIDGNFPDYQRVVPKDNTIKIDIVKEDLAGALKRVSLLASDNTKGVLFYFNHGALTLSTSSPERGEARENIDIGYVGGPLNIGFNAKYVLDVLGAVPDKTATFHFKDELSPCLISCDSDPGFRAVIMPMRM